MGFFYKLFSGKYLQAGVKCAGLQMKIKTCYFTELFCFYLLPLNQYIMEKKLSHIIANCFVNLPFDQLSLYDKLIRKFRIQPEIGLEGEILYTCTKDDFAEKAKFLEHEGLHCTLHAPFGDLSPGASDKHILEATRDKLRRCFELVEIFKPLSVICHLNYEVNKHSYHLDEWFQNSLATWREFLSVAKQHSTTIMFENTYETSPEIHHRILETLKSPQARFCLDTGHLMAFAQNPWQNWLPPLENWLGQLHLHDNRGSRDEHLPIGAGDFDFAGLFAYLKQQKLDPLITLEPRSETDLWESLKALDRLGLFDHKIESQ
jgi:sugar phosphate isomerase/epimerase